MSKYIKLEDAIIALGERPLNWTDSESEIQAQNDFDYYKEVIESLPTIDIVRCKDCTYAKPTNTENVIQCTWLSGYAFRIEHYCSAGERIEE